VRESESVEDGEGEGERRVEEKKEEDWRRKRKES
jgi:hypothetical protein